MKKKNKVVEKSLKSEVEMNEVSEMIAYCDGAAAICAVIDVLSAGTDC